VGRLATAIQSDGDRRRLFVDADHADRALAAAEGEIHRLEALLSRLNGPEICCDAVLLAVGAEPAREVLREGLHVCSDAASGPGHWTSAAADGIAAARRILGLEPHPPQP
jgi:hypothetical protein